MILYCKLLTSHYLRWIPQMKVVYSTMLQTFHLDRKRRHFTVRVVEAPIILQMSFPLALNRIHFLVESNLPPNVLTNISYIASR